jgi:hypothetical protein
MNPIQVDRVVNFAFYALMIIWISLACVVYLV